MMGAYSSLDGVPCCANSFLLTKILRDEWGFKGYVVSDCGAIWDIYAGHKYAPDLATASALAVKAGCDLTCGDEFTTLKDAVARGLIAEKDIDRAVTSLMLARFKLGMFDPPDAVPYSKITIADNDTKEHRELARKVADENIVLLKNTRDALPLKKISTPSRSSEHTPMILMCFLVIIMVHHPVLLQFFKGSKTS